MTVLCISKESNKNTISSGLETCFFFILFLINVECGKLFSFTARLVKINLFS